MCCESALPIRLCIALLKYLLGDNIFYFWGEIMKSNWKLVSNTGIALVYTVLFSYGAWNSFASCQTLECDEHSSFYYDNNGQGTTTHVTYDKTTAKGCHSDTPLGDQRVKHQHASEAVWKSDCAFGSRTECTNGNGNATRYYPGSCSMCQLDKQYFRYFCAKGNPLEGVAGSWNEFEQDDE